MQVTNQSKRYTRTTYNLQVLDLQSVRYAYTTSNFKAKVGTIQYYATLISEKRKLTYEANQYATPYTSTTFNLRFCCLYLCVQISYLYLCLY